MYQDNSKEIARRFNDEIDRVKMAYKLKDSKGNIHVFSGTENGIALYRNMRGVHHISNLQGYEVVQQYKY